jgi:type III restriction enzyme
MSEEKYLYQRLVEEFGRKAIDKTEIPQFIFSNLRAGYGERAYQQTAFKYFLNYWNESFEGKPRFNHQLLFHMATGSGKTLIMAGIIIYLYEQGYRNFLFFVNSGNIIDKTRDNFLNQPSSKYLFAETISIGDKQIRIKEVDNFQAANQEDINIVFSTIQGLHSRLNTPQENSLTYDDFEDQKIVLISDEAHHINADTKKGKKNGQTKADLDAVVDFTKMSEDELEIVSWEGTVNRIFNANPFNVLLEFTATADLAVPEIAEKYNDKLVFDYPLKQFRKDGYSKEVKVLQADLSAFERALQAVLLNQYRLKIFTKHKKKIKPVILFKSKTINESKNFIEEFSGKMQSLAPADIEKIKNNPQLDPAIKRMFVFFEDNNITFENLITELILDFAPEKLISVNSKDESVQKQIAVNTLEDEANEYRAVFAVDKLNEGWDVLNLFDIVRLYDTRDAKEGKPGKTTMSEAQLIGRGARYCPFQITLEQPLTQRKYDAEVENELRICEELYYHSAYNPRYIQELNTALEEIGIKPRESIDKAIRLKENFKETHFYKAGYIFLNERKDYDRSDIFSLEDNIKNRTFKIQLNTGFTRSQLAFGKVEKTNIETKMEKYPLAVMGKHVIRKALNKIEFYQFDNLSSKKFLPNLKSIDEFITSENYLGSVKHIEITGLPEQVKNLSSEEKLLISSKVLVEIANIITSDKIEFKGSPEFKASMFYQKIYDKTRNYAINDDSDKEEGKSMVNESDTPYRLDLGIRDWFVFDDCFGTSEEKLFIKYIDSAIDKIKAKYDEVYLVRNERHFKVYNFEDGAALEPDFVLFLIKKDDKESMHYQIFIEPKGQHLLAEDKWKEDFLKSLKDQHKLEQLWEGHKYFVWGMPFYNEKHRKIDFDESFKEVIK